MTARSTAAPFVPATRSLRVLGEAVHACRGCPLYLGGTRAVFGEGPRDARLMLVGEVPGDREERAGHPFVGPAGHLLDEALAHAGIARADAYLTNAVKHFKYTQRGKRRIHGKPTRYEQVACKPWLDAELAIVKPRVLVLMGAVAAQTLLGAAFRVSQSHGEVLATPHAAVTIATLHPASVLRAPDDAARAESRARFFADFAKVRAALEHARAA